MCRHVIFKKIISHVFFSGRNDEAEFYLNKAAKFNGLKPIDRSILLDNVMKDNKSIPVKKQRIIDFFKRPKLILYMASMGFIMSSSNLVYFGLNLMSGALAGDPYINYMALALVEIIGVFMAIASVSYYGRRIPIMLFFFWGAVFMFLAVIFTKVESLKDDLGEKKLGDFVTSFTIIGKIGITAAYCVILVYIQEIYPTYMRAFGIGMTAGLGNIGSILAPVALLAVSFKTLKECKHKSYIRAKFSHSWRFLNIGYQRQFLELYRLSLVLSL